MFIRKLTLGAALMAALATTQAAPSRAGEFTALEPNQRIADFVVEAIYENESGKEMGARFRHEPSGFALDVLRIQSIPQAFTWVNSPPPSSQGEPHTLEHLLLGKGTKGQYVASLEDMSLGRSSAYTEQRRTCYHFHTEAGKDVFFKLFAEKLDAMLNPTFTDEEIRREVCNMGLVDDKESGKLWLEEKGTVYNEMVSTYERPWGQLYQVLLQSVYGPGHPLAQSAGGEPSAIRQMQPEDIRKFHGGTHHLNNMGSVVSIGDEISLGECLTSFSAILSRVEPNAERGEDPADLYHRLPPANPAPAGEITLTHFPHQNENEPGVIAFAWPATRMDMSAYDLYMMELFLDLLASGQTSNLYKKFIDSQTRIKDLGANSVGYWMWDQPGQPFFMYLSNVDADKCTKEEVADVRRIISEEIKSIANWAPGSEELKEFNERAMNQVISDRRATRK
ncbi:MAG: M16 family metallopeptidase, partial [Candidatus Zixiibacteriota bacterium]